MEPNGVSRLAFDQSPENRAQTKYLRSLRSLAGIACAGSLALHGAALDNDPPAVNELQENVLSATVQPTIERIEYFSEGLEDIDPANCTPSYTQEAAASHHRLFEASDFDALSLTEIKDVTLALGHSLELQRHNLGFAELPANYPDLLADAYSNEPQLSVETYRVAAQEVLTQLDIELVMEWDQTTGALNIAPPQYAVPLPNLDETVEDHMKTTIFGVMQALASYPPEFVEASGLKKIYLGRVVYNNSLGLAVQQDGYIAMDAARIDSISNARRITDHEVTHLLPFSQCLVSADEVWEFKHPSDLPLSDETWYQMRSEKILPNGYTAASIVSGMTDEQLAEHPDLTIVAGSPYGVSSRTEGLAVIGEKFLNPHTVSELFVAPESSETLNWQTALLATEIAALAPKSANYYQTIAHVSLLRQHISDRLVTIVTDRRAYSEELAGKQWEIITETPRYKEMTSDIESCRMLLRQLDDIRNTIELYPDTAYQPRDIPLEELNRDMMTLFTG